jgi:SAM-dependent methyltransferase
MQSALTDQSYWEDIWQFADDEASAMVPTVVPSPFTRHLERAFEQYLLPGKRFIEIGAGGSAWPAHVNKALGADAWGIDFSRWGLLLAGRAARGSEVTLVEGDVFDSSKLPDGTFDLVFSGGFVEHFPDLGPLMERLRDLLTPGGIMVTAVPNLRGLNGLVQRLIDADTFRRHVLHSPTSLDAAHVAVGLVPVDPARHIGAVDVGSVNMSRLAQTMPHLGWRALSFALAKLRAAGAFWHEQTGRHAGRILAPVISGTYRRPNA